MKKEQIYGKRQIAGKGRMRQKRKRDIKMFQNRKKHHTRANKVIQPEEAWGGEERESNAETSSSSHSFWHRE